ncbi:MAG: UDP-N-acetylmuramoyl-L-alanine--D-glutamate ligase [Pirellulales bacterium]
MTKLQKVRVTVMGLGRHGGGVGVVRYLAERGARVTVTDLQPADALTDSLGAVADLPIERYRLGGHDPGDFETADCVVVNPAVPPGHPLLRLARSRGVPVTTEIDLLLDGCPTRLAAVTGSNGKSTTCAMLAEILRADGRPCHLGGNFGISLLPHVDTMHREDWVVLELSSFQLARLSRSTRGADVAIVTGCTPNHLDWHGTLDEYVRAKQRILTAQSTDSLAILCDHDPRLREWMPLVRGRLLSLRDDAPLDGLGVPGLHNRQNARLAATAAEAIGCTRQAIARALHEFPGLPHRLGCIGEVQGRQFYDDSKSTTPEATAVALETLAGRTWLLAGGHDKGADLELIAGALARHGAGACFFGAAADRLTVAAAQHASRAPVSRKKTLSEALHWCWQRSQPGDRILLSPGCASFDQFRDYVHRAEVFARLVNAMKFRDSPDFASV